MLRLDVWKLLYDRVHNLQTHMTREVGCSPGMQWGVWPKLLS